MRYDQRHIRCDMNPSIGQELSIITHASCSTTPTGWHDRCDNDMTPSVGQSSSRPYPSRLVYLILSKRYFILNLDNLK